MVRIVGMNPRPVDWLYYKPAIKLSFVQFDLFASINPWTRNGSGSAEPTPRR
jgi:hypothetical protein